jgi:uncharacterized protein YndB with AHSA1/START domain
VSAVIENSIDIECDPQEVFDYVSDPARLPEWQPAVETAAVDSSDGRRVGMRGHEVRRTPAGRRTVRWEVTECEPASRWAVRGVNGPLRAHVTFTFAASATGTRVEQRTWLEPHALGRLLQPLVLSGIRTEIPGNLALLKQRLEGTR